MPTKENVKTGVDGLVDLLKKNGKTSLADVSKKLGVPQSTIETWVDFLVEEGKVELEYKFTTPFVSLKDEGEGEEEHEDLSITDDDLESEINDRGNSGNPSGSGSKNPSVSASLEDISQMIDSGNIDSAYDEYMKLKSYAESIASESEMKNVIAINQKLVSKVVEMQNISKEKITKMDSIVSEIQSILSQGKVEDSKERYSELLSLYDSIPKILAPERAAAYDRVSYIYRAIESAENRLAQDSVKEAEQKVFSLRDAISSLLKQGKTEEAQGYYQSLCSVYDGIPQNIIADKLKIYNVILRVHREIVLAKKFKELKSELQSLGSEIDFSNNTSGSVESSENPSSSTDSKTDSKISDDRSPGSDQSDHSKDIPPPISNAHANNTNEVGYGNEIAPPDIDFGQMSTIKADKDENNLSIGMDDSPAENGESTREEGEGVDEVSDSRHDSDIVKERELLHSSMDDIKNLGNSSGSGYDDLPSFSDKNFLISGKTGQLNPRMIHSGHSASEDAAKEMSDTDGGSSKTSSTDLMDTVPSVSGFEQDDEPTNPEMIFGERGPEIIEEMPSAYKENGEMEGSEAEVDDYNLVVEASSEVPGEFDEDSMKRLKVLEHSYLEDEIGSDEMLRKGIYAYNNKDYFMAKHIFEILVKNNPDNTKARQMRDIIRGILGDRDDEFYLGERKNIMLN